MSFLLEVIACSVADAVAAEQGGADRLELISRFDLGGLTPGMELVDRVLQAVSIPVRVMLRDETGFSASDQQARDRLCQKAEQLARMQVDGLVLGFLHNQALDENILAELLHYAPRTAMTFHRAFEKVTDPLQTIQRLKTFARIDRILTSGGEGSLQEKCAKLNTCAEAAKPEITVLAGGGITAASIIELTKIGITEFHVGRAVRKDESLFGAVDPDRVARLKESLPA